jgi:hypothetical protein
MFLRHYRSLETILIFESQTSPRSEAPLSFVNQTLPRDLLSINLSLLMRVELLAVKQWIVQEVLARASQIVWAVLDHTWELKKTLIQSKEK